MGDDETAVARRRGVHALPERTGGPKLKALIVTGDDFGFSVSVNQAIERAHRDGILGTASLMVAGAAAADAVARAHQMPSLKVGLHVVVTRDRALLPSERIPALVGANGRLPANLVVAGFRFFFRSRARAQLKQEVRAQFAAFARTGLVLDHVNVHNHMHLHPTVLGIILAAGREYGLRAVRLPYEPFLPSWRAAGGRVVRRFAAWALLAPWVAVVKYRLRRANLCCNDYLFGMNDTGRMDRDRVLKLISHLPDGVSELHFHPTTDSGASTPAHGEGDGSELDALTDPTVGDALRNAGVTRVGFGDLGPGARSADAPTAR